MKLVINRAQAEKKGMLGGHKGVRFTLSYRLEFDPEEHQLLEHYKMWDYSVFKRAELPVTLRSLANGESQTLENVEILLRNEDILKDSLDVIPALFKVLRTFGGQDEVHYPREDR